MQSSVLLLAMKRLAKRISYWHICSIVSQRNMCQPQATFTTVSKSTTNIHSTEEHSKRMKNEKWNGFRTIKIVYECVQAVFFFFFCFILLSVDVTVDESPVKVELADTAGQDFLDPLRRLCYPDSDVFLLCFSVIKPDTFVAVREKWAPIFRKTHKPIVLIGTQSDLRSDSAVISQLLVNIRSICCFMNFKSMITCELTYRQTDIENVR